MGENKKPSIRFSGFTDAWEQRKVGHLGNIVTGSTPPTNDQANYGGQYLFVSPADIQGARYVENTITTLSEKGFCMSRILKEGSVLFVSIGSTIGKVAQTKGLATTNQQINAIEANDILDKDFIFSLMENKAKFIKGLAATQAVPIVNKTSFSEVDTYIPDDSKEQSQIGEFFKHLDNLITLHQRKYDKLQNVKKSMLEKMFPKNESNTPEIRFKGFTDAWEQRKLGDVVDLRGGRDYKHLSNGDIPVYGTGGYMLSVNEALSYDEDAIGIGRKGTIDKPYILSAPFWTVDTLFYAVPREKYDLNFVFNIFQNIDWKKKDESTGVPSLSKTAINSIEVRTPNYREQKTIGNYFATIDNLITLHQRKYDKLQNVKKSMLEKMFPKNESNTPEIRFKGFTDAWEQCKLTDEVELFSGLTYSPNNIVKDNGTFVLRSSNVKNGEVVDADNVYVNSEVVNSCNVKNGDIIVVVRNGSRSLIGKHAQIKGDMDKTVIGAFMTGLRSDHSNFINALLDTHVFKSEIDKNLGATINQITNGMFHQMKFMIPKPEEQDQIGKLFTGLDNLITLHQRELEKLQNIKKSCLERMFV